MILQATGPDSYPPCRHRPVSCSTNLRIPIKSTAYRIYLCNTATIARVTPASSLSEGQDQLYGWLYSGDELFVSYHADAKGY